jgi:hypothetical protein
VDEDRAVFFAACSAAAYANMRRQMCCCQAVSSCDFQPTPYFAFGPEFEKGTAKNAGKWYFNHATYHADRSAEVGTQCLSHSVGMVAAVLFWSLCCVCKRRCQVEDQLAAMFTPLS